MPSLRYTVGSWLVVLGSLLAPAISVEAAEKIRVYEFGESDPGAALGGTAFETVDSQIPLVPGSDLAGGADLVSLTAEFFEGEPTYVEGRGGPGTFALDFDGVDDRLISPAFDSRNFNASFSALSQAWLRPDPAKQGEQQFVWSLGTDNGGVGITTDGFWQIIASNIIPDTPSTVPVAFDEWSHLALHRTGNNAFLYVNGQLVASGAGFWNGPGMVTVGNRTSENPLSSTAFYDGAIDDFALSGFGFDGQFGINPAEDLDFFADLVISGVPGDVDQDGDADQDDYGIWSENVGFDNGLGSGDPSTLLLGDLDQNGRINFFDFSEIVQAAQSEGNAIVTGVPEPSSLMLVLAGIIGAACWRVRGGKAKCVSAACLGGLLLLGAFRAASAEVIVADDFFYMQPTKVLGPGGGFTLQDYAGGQNGSQGQWEGRWVSVGNGIITGPDHMAEEERLQAFVDVGLSLGELNRNYSFSGLADEQTLFFGARMRTDDVFQTPDARFNINPTESGAEIGFGFSQSGHVARLGDQTTLGFGLVDDAEYHTLVGKLEINAVGDSERLTVWLDPIGAEMGPDSAVVENDVVTGIGDFAGNLQLYLNIDGGTRVWWDDVAIGTTWQDAATVEIPRLRMVVNQNTGSTQLINETGSDVSFNYLEIASPNQSGSLSPMNWSSLDDQDMGGGAWQENNPTPNLLTESNFSGSTTLADGQSLTLGRAYMQGQPQDLVARIGDATGLLNLVPIEYVEGGIPGDYSGNGLVEQADLDLVLGNWGADAGDVPATWINDPPEGFVDQAELDKVLGNWGSQLALSAGLQPAAVPEPSAWLLTFAVSVLLLGAKLRGKSGGR